MEPDTRLEEENRLLLSKNEQLTRGLASFENVVEENQKLKAEVKSLRETVRRLNNEMMALKAGNSSSGPTVARKLPSPRLGVAGSPPPSPRGHVSASPPPSATSPAVAPILFSRSSGRSQRSEMTAGDLDSSFAGGLGSNSTVSSAGEEDAAPRAKLFRRAPLSPRTSASEDVASVSSPTATKRNASARGDYGEISVTILSVKRVNRNSFFLIGLRNKNSPEFVIVPRLYQEFKELHSSLVKHFGEIVIPELVQKKGSEKELQLSLEAFLVNIATFEQTARSSIFVNFVNPKFQPSFFTLSEVLKSKKQSKIQFTTSLQRGWKSYHILLFDSLFLYRSEDEIIPTDFVELKWITIEIVQKLESGPAYIFKINDLLKDRELFFGVDSTKEVTEWILALREQKTQNKKGSFMIKDVESFVAPNSGVIGSPNGAQNASRASDNRRPENFEIFESWLRDDLGSRGNAINAESDIKIKKTPVKLAMYLGATPIPIDYADNSPETIFLRSKDDGSSQLVGASQSRLLVILLDPDFDDSNFANQFVTVFPIFLGLKELFLTIVQRYLSVDDFMVRNRCVSLVQKLLEVHLFEFLKDSKLCHKTLEFVRNSVEPNFHTVGWLIRENLERHMPNNNKQKNTSNKGSVLKRALKPVLPDIYHRHTFDFLDLNSVEVARQLTILESDLFRSINAKELINQAWNDAESKEHNAPNVTSTIRRFNLMSGWITSLIVSITPIRPRVFMLTRFIEIANACLELNNLNSVVEIVSGLQTTSVRRLTETFAELSEECQIVYQNLRDFLETKKNWQRYRRRLASVKGPCVPYLGICLTDLTMIDEKYKKTISHPDFENVKLLNFERASKIADIVTSVCALQKEQYPLASVSYFQEYLLRLDQLSEEQCMELSLEIQPRK